MKIGKIKALTLLKGLDIGGIDGGAERFGAELAGELAAQCEMTCFLFFKRGTGSEAFWLERLKKAGVNCQFAAAGEGSYRARIASIERFCEAHPQHIVHSHFQVGTLAAIWLKLRRRTSKIIRTAHVTTEWGRKTVDVFRRLLFTRFLFPWLVDCEVGVSEAVVMNLRRYWVGRLLRKTPRLIYNAISITEISQARAPCPEVEALGRHKWVVGSVGRLTAQKDYQTWLRAFALAYAKAPDLFGVIIGDGEEAELLHAQANELHLTGALKFVGVVSSAAPWLRGMQVFVLSSRWEGLPTVILESMAVGVPVIATDIPGSNELVENGKTGFLVPPKDAQALAEMILWVKENQVAAQAAAQAAGEQLARFSIQAAAKQYAGLYRDLLG